MFKVIFEGAATRGKVVNPNTRDDPKAMIASGMCFR